MTQPETKLDDRLGRFAPIGLSELVDSAELLTRVDRKYLLTGSQATDLIDQLPDDSRVLQIGESAGQRYLSSYFDTPELYCFHRAATGRRRRFKVRTRSYLNTGQTFLEVKDAGVRGTTVKHRTPYSGQANGQLTAASRIFVDACLADRGWPDFDSAELTPVLTCRCTRVTLLLPDQTRVTLDTGLAWTLPSGTDPAASDRLGLTLMTPQLVVVETKSDPGPSIADRLLWRQGHRPEAVSKYATGLAALRPELPHHRWQRVLHDHFIPTESTPATTRS